MTERLEIWYIRSLQENKLIPIPVFFYLKNYFRFWRKLFFFCRPQFWISRSNEVTQRLEIWYIGYLMERQSIPIPVFFYLKNCFRFWQKLFFSVVHNFRIWRRILVFCDCWGILSRKKELRENFLRIIHSCKPLKPCPRFDWNSHCPC